MENHHFFIGKSTISMAMFNSYVSLPGGISTEYPYNNYYFWWYDLDEW